MKKTVVLEVLVDIEPPQDEQDEQNSVWYELHKRRFVIKKVDGVQFTFGEDA